MFNSDILTSSTIQLNEYLPAYQPIISLNSGRIEGYECLARFRGPGDKLYSAGNLFQDERYEVNERLNLDRHLRQQAFDFFADMPGSGYVSVNISPGWVDRIEDFTEQTLPSIEMARQSGIDLSRIVVEITEISGDMEKLIQAVKLYQAVGMLVAIDDFGIGASQVDRIEALKPDIVKLDMALFKDAVRKKGVSKDIAMAVHSMASRLGCHMVCEGVESEEEFNFALECGCSHIQGYLFAHASDSPLEADSFNEDVMLMKRSFLEKKQKRMTAALQQYDNVRKAVLKIRNSLLEKEKIAVLDGEKLERTGVIRYYVCDISGNQLSPNYEVKNGSIDVHQHRHPMNWSHRPYFALFQAQIERLPAELYTSGMYRDIRSRSLCQTFCILLDDKRLLLSDIRVPEPTLLMDTRSEPIY